MIGFAMAAVAAVALQSNCVGGLCNIRALDPYFDKLARVRRGSGQPPIHILQIGDSHTAGDTITGAWREVLQARYGGGGRGMLAAGRPYNGYLTRGVTAEMSPGWRIAATFGGASAPPRPPMGLSGFSLTAAQAGAKVALQADAGQMFDRFVLCAALRPDGGSVTIASGASTERMNLDSVSARVECKTIRLPQAQFRVEVTTDSDRPVTITSWATFRDNGGVALTNVGVVGSQLQHFARTDDAVVAEELRTYRPDLIVIAFGTNEGFSPVFRPSDFDIMLRTQIGRLRRLSPGTPILLLGAPDAMTRRPEMARNAPGPFPAPCAEPPAERPAPPPPPRPATIAPADDAPLASVMDSLRQSAGTTPDTTVAPIAAPPQQAPVVAASPASVPVATRGPWSVRAQPLFPPAGLAAVRDVQRRVAASLGVAFWDWEARMGGRCSSIHWVKDAPARMRGDYVHFNSSGGRDIAQRLQADLDRAAAIEAQR